MTAQAGPRSTLMAERARVLGRISALERDFASLVQSAEGADDEHDPEGATIAFERQHVAALIEQAGRQLRGIDDAIGRLDAGRYGVCTRCGRPIPAERLAARPTASTCVRCAARRDPRSRVTAG
jgi:DnaK suppressor protein